jgi:hypothetical protein
MNAMVTRGIREFVDRDWAAVRASKDEYWGERIARLGPLEGWRIVDELRRQALRQNPDWPSAHDRDSDLQFHVRLAQLFRRAGSARGR